MVKSECKMVFAAVAVILLGITSTQAEAPLNGYDSYAPSGGYASSSPGYAYGPPKEAGIPGRAGVDYPDFTEVPPTSFSCERQPLPGYYADPEAGCQVYHVCEKGVKEREPMLCPVGSIFDQEKLTCAWWYTVDCARSAAAAPAVNAEVVAAMEEADALARASKYGYGRGKPSGAYGPPSNTYGPPIGAFGTPSASYGAPSASIGGSSASFGGPSASYGAPSASIGGSSASFGGPSASYGAPSAHYGAPSATYGAPAGQKAIGSLNGRSGAFNSLRRVYGAPARRFGGLFNGAVGSSRSYASPSRAYGAPSSGAFGFGGGALSGSYRAPSIGSPSQVYGAPGGGAYLPPSF